MALEDYPELAKLPLAEKLSLIEQLWDSITANEAVLPVPQSHQDELTKRQASLPKERLLSLKELKRRVDKHK